MYGAGEEITVIGDAWRCAGEPCEALVCGAPYAWDCDEALAVMMCESSGHADAFNAGNYGLFQINAVHAARVGGDLQSLFDPAVNVRVAYEIWSDQSWIPWACKP